MKLPIPPGFEPKVFLMFAIGDREWPGLSKLAEECGEVVQVIGKLMGTRGQIIHWDGSNLRKRLEEEIADVQAACDFVLQHCPLDLSRVQILREKKLKLFGDWHAKQDPL